MARAFNPKILECFEEWNVKLKVDDAFFLFPLSLTVGYLVASPDPTNGGGSNKFARAFH